MEFKRYSFKDLLENIVDNRGKTCPVENEGLPLIATNCIKENSLYAQYERVRFVSDETYESWFRGHPEPEDIIFVCKGSPGRVAWVQNPVPYCIAQDMVAIRAKKSVINSKFLFALLRNPKTQKSILNMHVGTMIPHFKKGDFSNLYFDIPMDLEYQKWAGELYFKFCEKIELNKQTNQTLEQMAQTMFKSWFVDFDPVFDNLLVKVDFKLENLASDFPEALLKRAKKRLLTLDDKVKAALLSTEQSQNNIHKHFPSEFEHNEQLGWIPKGWEDIAVNKMVNTVSETYPLKTVDEVIFLNTGDILDGKFLHRNYSESQGLPGQAKKSIKKGDILYSEIRPKNKRFALVNFDGKEHVVSTKLMVLRPNEGFEELFPYFVLTQDSNITLLQRAAESRSGTFPQITYTELSMIKVALSQDKKVMQLFIENHLKHHFARQSQLHFQNETLTNLRDTLLPKLISGELKIPGVKVANEKTA